MRNKISSQPLGFSWITKESAQSAVKVMDGLNGVSTAGLYLLQLQSLELPKGMQGQHHTTVQVLTWTCSAWFGVVKLVTHNCLSLDVLRCITHQSFTSPPLFPYSFVTCDRQKG